MAFAETDAAIHVFQLVNKGKGLPIDPSLSGLENIREIKGLS